MRQRLRFASSAAAVALRAVHAAMGCTERAVIRELHNIDFSLLSSQQTTYDGQRNGMYFV